MAKTKHQYDFTHDGQRFTRATNRDYRFAVLNKRSASGSRWDAECCKTLRTDKGLPGDYYWVCGYTSRADLAEKQAAKDRNEPWNLEVVVLPIEPV